jgi:hypothetical protein
MEEGMFEGLELARLDQKRAEATDWARALVDLRTNLCAGGFGPREAYRLSELWFGEHLCHELRSASWRDSDLD